MAKQTEEEKRDEALEEKFASRLQFVVKILRPSDKYPYEREVWVSEISVPITDSETKIDSVVNAWVKTMEAGIELAGTLSEKEDDG